MNWHLAWVWAMFVAGELTYMLMRSHFMVRGPRPVATDYTDFIRRAWGPLLFRFGWENAIFGMLVNPQVAPLLLEYMGWQSMATTIKLLIQFAPVTYMMGLCGDVIMDFSVVKIPYLNTIWPQMPPPLPQPAIIQSAIVETTTNTRVTELATKTTMVPDPKESK